MFYDLYEELCRNRGVKPTPTAIDMGFSKSTATKWKKSKATPDGDSLSKIASYFGVTTDYLLGKGAENSKKPVIDDGELSKAEADFIKLWRKVSPDRKQMLSEMIIADLKSKGLL